MEPGPSGDCVAIIVGAHPFPHGNASANRMLGLAKVLEAAGFSAAVVNDDPRPGTGRPPPKGVVDNIPYWNLEAPTTGRWRRWRRRRTFGARIAEAVAEAVGRNEVQVVCVPSFFYTPRTRRALRKVAPTATMVVDVVERHDPSQFPRRRVEPYFVRHRFTSWYARRAADQVIVISSALADGPFRSRRPFVLPPTVQTDDFRVPAHSTRPLGPTTVTYVGTPGSKDDLASVVHAVGLLTTGERGNLRLAIGGVDRDELANLPGLSARALVEIDDVLEVVGKLDRSGVVALLSRSHFTILIRDPKAGFARYGFPTKVPESLAAGCPPIVNLTSDLAHYLTDGQDSLVCASASVDDISDNLRRAISGVANAQHDTLRASSVRTAEERFSPTAWGAAIRSWLSDEGGRRGTR